jgi:hypothetical protein
MGISGVLKSFTLRKGLQEAILITMKYADDELAQSFPISQVIPL